MFSNKYNLGTDTPLTNSNDLICTWILNYSDNFSVSNSDEWCKLFTSSFCERKKTGRTERTSDPQIKSNEDRICREGEPQPNLILFGCECWQAKFFFHNSLFKSLPQFYYLHSRLSWEDVGCCCSTTFAVAKVKFGFDESGCRPS